MSLLVAIGVNSEGYREILGICEGAKEDKAGWSAFLKHLKERKLKNMRLIISDACIGLAESAAEFFPDAAWQRCVPAWLSNSPVSGPARSSERLLVASMTRILNISTGSKGGRPPSVRSVKLSAALNSGRNSSKYTADRNVSS
jgi:putative transposase